jgi:uncharacterized delta-60 repeat protein
MLIAAGRTSDYISLFGELAVAQYTMGGELDTAFGENGIASSSVRIDNTNNNLLITLPDGKLLVAGNGYSDSVYHAFLIRYNNNGTIDTTFAKKGTLHLKATFSSKVVVQTDGKIITGANYNTYNGSAFDGFALVRFQADGTLDSSYGQQGVVRIDPANFGYGREPMYLQKDNKLVFSYFTYSSEPPYSLTSTIARYNTDGSLDASFGRGGKIIRNSFQAVLYKQKDDKLWIYEPLNPEKQDTIVVKRYTGDSHVDSSFGQDGSILLPSRNNLIAEQASGKFIVKLTGATHRARLSGTASGKTFNKGITYVTYTLQSDTTQSCTFAVKVNDTEPPVLSNVTLSKVIVWPSNHNLQDVTVNYNALDNCGIANIKLSVRDDETGTNLFDWQLIDAHHIRLRTEDLCSLAGKTFTITATATDLSANTTSKSITLTIPEHLPGCNSEAEEQKLQVSAFPNPTRSFFQVHIKSRNRAQPVTVRITSSTGKVLETRQVTANNQLQFGSHYRPGIYYIEAEQAGVKTTAKLVKLP